ncbi:MAG TPA: DUF4097 family beta strand repeat-containing protein [Candidatus Dormibacteraeota bacterium]|nr:DUF4097 family beta strand repeat-containing protein [Candidatus Dormibacteraeota bacterium]
MALQCNFTARGWILFSALTLAGCNMGPGVTGSFDRTYSVTTPARLELANASGDVEIVGTAETIGSADGKVHVHAEVRSSGMGFDNPQKRLDDTIADPPIEQRGNTIRIGKEMSHIRNLTISYRIQVPHDIEISTTLASGAQTIIGVRGPLKAQTASGTIRADKIDREVQLTTVSGSIEAGNLADDVRVSSASGSVHLANVKGDVRVNAIAGSIDVTKPGGRVQADSVSGSVDLRDANGDVKAHAISGRVAVQGNPAANNYWDLRTVSGGVQLNVPLQASFRLTAEAVTGDIRTDIPIVIEEQGKHSLRAHLGNGGGRVEVHTVSGEIRIGGAN